MTDTTTELMDVFAEAKKAFYGEDYDTTAEAKFNYAVLDTEELWILENAYYDYENEEFVKVDDNDDALGIQIKESGVYIKVMETTTWSSIFEVTDSSIKAMVDGVLTTLGEGGSSDILNQSIVNGDTTHAPSGDAVYDALANKLNTVYASYKGKNVVTDGITGEITFENKPVIPTDVSELTDNDNTAFTPKSHTHGNLKNDGTVGSSSNTNKNVVTDSNGKITTENKPTIPSATSSTPLTDATGGAVGSSSDYARADHQHPLSSSYLTAADIANMEVTTNKSSNMTTDTGSTTKYPTVKAVQDYIDSVIGDADDWLTS